MLGQWIQKVMDFPITGYMFAACLLMQFPISITVITVSVITVSVITVFFVSKTVFENVWEKVFNVLLMVLAFFLEMLLPSSVIWVVLFPWQVSILLGLTMVLEMARHSVKPGKLKVFGLSLKWLKCLEEKLHLSRQWCLTDDERFNLPIAVAFGVVYMGHYWTAFWLIACTVKAKFTLTDIRNILGQMRGAQERVAFALVVLSFGFLAVQRPAFYCCTLYVLMFLTAPHLQNTVQVGTQPKRWAEVKERNQDRHVLSIKHQEGGTLGARELKETLKTHLGEGKYKVRVFINSTSNEWRRQHSETVVSIGDVHIRFAWTGELWIDVFKGGSVEDKYPTSKEGTSTAINILLFETDMPESDILVAVDRSFARVDGLQLNQWQKLYQKPGDFNCFFVALQPICAFATKAKLPHVPVGELTDFHLGPMVVLFLLARMVLFQRKECKYEVAIIILGITTLPLLVCGNILARFFTKSNLLFNLLSKGKHEKLMDVFLSVADDLCFFLAIFWLGVFLVSAIWALGIMGLQIAFVLVALVILLTGF